MGPSVTLSLSPSRPRHSKVARGGGVLGGGVRHKQRDRESRSTRLLETLLFWTGSIPIKDCSVRDTSPLWQTVTVSPRGSLQS